MADKIDCPECGKEIESADELEKHGEVHEIETDDDSFSLFGNRDLFLCKDCKKPLGVGRSPASE